MSNLIRQASSFLQRLTCRWLPYFPHSCRIIAAQLPLNCLIIAASAQPQILQYDATNKWPKTQSPSPLRAVIAEAKKNKSKVFHISLPKEGGTPRELSIARLKVARDILEDSLGTGLLFIEKPDQETPANTVLIDPQK